MELKVTVSWCDRYDKKGVAVGMVDMIEPIARPLAGYRRAWWMPEDEHGVYLMNGTKQIAIEMAETIRREVRFIEATGLYKTPWLWDVVAGTDVDEPPRLNMSQMWKDIYGRYVATTEPYRDESTIPSMQRWCEERGWSMAVAPTGVGMWEPARLPLIVLSPPTNGADVELVLAAAMDAAQPKQQGELIVIRESLYPWRRKRYGDGFDRLLSSAEKAVSTHMRLQAHHPG